MAQANSLKSILFALGANFSIFVAKLFAAIYTGSGAMMAEAIHSLADASNQALLLLGLKQSRRVPSDEHPMGYGKSIYFWSFIVAMILFSMGGLYAIYEGVHKWNHPEEITAPWIAIGVLLFAIGAEMVALRACVVEVNKVLGDRSYWQWFRQSRQSALVVIFAEDTAAITGLIVALIAVVLTMVTGNPMFDAGGTILIGVLLVIISVFIAIEVKALLIGQGVDPRERRQILNFLEARPEIEEIYNMRSLQMGPDALVAIKARMRKAETGRALVDDINAVERDLKSAFPQVVWLFFEPDVTDD